MEDNVSLAFSQGYDFVLDNKWWLVAGTFLVWIIMMFLWPNGEQQKTETVIGEQLEIITPEQEIIIPPDPVVPEIIDSEIAVPEEAVEPIPKREVELTDAKESVIDVRPLEKKETVTKKIEKVVEPERTKKKVVAKKPLLVEPVTEKKAEPPVLDADALFEERVKASSAWLAWAYRGGYTIQLMVLASDKAERNLKRILVDKKYYDVKNQLYILRKRSPKTIYVFYGNYPGMDEARQARNSMPPFLRENQPYVLSIKDALEKTKY